MLAVQLLVVPLGFASLCVTSPVTTIPLDATVVPLSGSLGLTVSRLIVKTHPIADAGHDTVAPQKLILDTGSSTLAYCASDIAKKVASKKQDDIVCNLYGDGFHGFWGDVYQGNVSIQSLVTLPSVYYAVMQDSVQMCDDGNDGIFGIAFKQLNEGFQGSTPPDNWTPQHVGSCPHPTVRPKVDMGNPLIQTVRGSAPSTLGIYWSGKPGNGEGFMYLDADATNNPHYKASSVLGPAKLGEYGWYDVFMTAFTVNGQKFTDTKLCECDSVDTCRGRCIMDTGTPWIMVPQNVYAAYTAAGTGTLGVTFAGKTGEDVTINMDIATLLKNKWVMSAEGRGIIMGLPLKAFYYTLYDIQAGTMSFVANSAMWNSVNTTWRQPASNVAQIVV